MIKDVPTLDLTNNDSILKFEDAKKVIIHWFYNDNPITASATLKMLETKLLKGLVVAGDDTTVLDPESGIVKEFIAKEEVQQIKDDDHYFEYFFTEMEHLPTWHLTIDTPDKKVYYKYEPDVKMMSVLSEAIVIAPLCNVIAMYSEGDLFQTWMPNCTGSTYFKELSHYRKGGNITLSMPWPVAHRNIVCRTSGLFDTKNKAILCVVKSISDETFFGTKVPKPE